MPYLPVSCPAAWALRFLTRFLFSSQAPSGLQLMGLACLSSQILRRAVCGGFRALVGVPISVPGPTGSQHAPEALAMSLVENKINNK